MFIVSDEDKYISTTWGAGIRLQAGVPKEVGEDLGLVCLQEGCRRVETIKEKNNRVVILKKIVIKKKKRKKKIQANLLIK